MRTKDIIITNTLAILATDGYTGTSMRKIASTCSIKPSLIYSHFTDKETLLRNVRIYITPALDQELKGFDYTLPATELLKKYVAHAMKQSDTKLICEKLHFFIERSLTHRSVLQGITA